MTTSTNPRRPSCIALSRGIPPRPRAATLALAPTDLLAPSQAAAVTVGFKKSDNTLLNVQGDVDQLLGLPVQYTPVRGTLGRQQTTIPTNGTATGVFTSTSSGAGSLTVK